MSATPEEALRALENAQCEIDWILVDEDDEETTVHMVVETVETLPVNEESRLPHLTCESTVHAEQRHFRLPERVVRQSRRLLDALVQGKKVLESLASEDKSVAIRMRCCDARAAAATVNLMEIAARMALRSSDDSSPIRFDVPRSQLVHMFLSAHFLNMPAVEAALAQKLAQHATKNTLNTIVLLGRAIGGELQHDLFDEHTGERQADIGAELLRAALRCYAALREEALLNARHKSKTGLRKSEFDGAEHVRALLPRVDEDHLHLLDDILCQRAKEVSDQLPRRAFNGVIYERRLPHDERLYRIYEQVRAEDLLYDEDGTCDTLHKICVPDDDDDEVMRCYYLRPVLRVLVKTDPVHEVVMVAPKPGDRWRDTDLAALDASQDDGDMSGYEEFLAKMRERHCSGFVASMDTRRAGTTFVLRDVVDNRSAQVHFDSNVLAGKPRKLVVHASSPFIGDADEDVPGAVWREHFANVRTYLSRPAKWDPDLLMHVLEFPNRVGMCSKKNMQLIRERRDLDQVRLHDTEEELCDATKTAPTVLLLGKETKSRYFINSSGELSILQAAAIAVAQLDHKNLVA